MLKLEIKIIFLLLIINLGMIQCVNQGNGPNPTVATEHETVKTIKHQYNNQDSKNKKEAMNLMADFNNEWESKMLGYNSDYTYYIPLKPRIQEVYYENVTVVPSTFKGAFIISEETTDKIEFVIKDPRGNPIYNKNEHHAIFEFNVTEVGRYSIIFNNKFSRNDLSITFTMTTGQNDVLSSKDLTVTEKKLESLSSFIKKFNIEFKLGHDIHSKRYKSK